MVVSLLMMPRFNQHDWAVSAITGTDGINLGDAEHYIEVAGFFAGEPRDSLTLVAPFSDRPLAPAIASVLPGGHMTGLNIVNALAVLAACFATFFTSLRLGLGRRYSLVATTLLGVSFPVFYYGTIGYVDPVVLAALAVGLLATVHERWWLVLVIVIFGVLTKESAGVAGMVAAVYLVTSRPTIVRGRTYVWVLGMIAAIGIAYIMSRNLVPGDGSGSWDPTIQKLKNNLGRPRSTIAVVLTFGLPTLIVVAAGAKANLKSTFPTPVLAALISGVVLAIAQLIVASATAFLDGRLVWGAQPYLVILAAAVVKSRYGTSVLPEAPRKLERSPE